MNGKDKCKILKEIRKQIAENNDIAWITEECSHKGNCSGTCPRCEAEVRKLEKELALRRSLGKVITIAGLGLAAMTAFVGCKDDSADIEEDHLTGEVIEPDDSLSGAIAEPDYIGDDGDELIYELDGDVAYPEEEEEVRRRLEAAEGDTDSACSTNAQESNE